MRADEHEDRAAALILKAIRRLPGAEQDEVLEALIARTMTPSGPFAIGGDPAFRWSDLVLDPGATPLPGPPFGIEKPLSMSLLVRLPEDLHARFRRWCTDNGFSMAAVTRGLIERFLKERGVSAPPDPA